jgi:hypothetical protein
VGTHLRVFLQNFLPGQYLEGNKKKAYYFIKILHRTYSVSIGLAEPHRTAAKLEIILLGFIHPEREMPKVFCTIEIFPEDLCHAEKHDGSCFAVLVVYPV